MRRGSVISERKEKLKMEGFDRMISAFGWRTLRLRFSVLEKGKVKRLE